jgi:membrane-associated protease RseP (regulator of RpoE activity)
MQNDMLALLFFTIFTIAGCAAPTTQRVSVSDEATRAEAAKQAEMAVQDMVEEQKRISRISRLLSTKANALCGEHVGPVTGYYAVTKPKGDLGSALEKNYGIQDQRTILFVLEGSPADVAGLKARDVIKKVNGVLTTDAKAMNDLYEKLPPEEPITYEVERSGMPLTISTKPERGCRYPVTLHPSQSINAFADGARVLIARGMVNFARDDNELALVIAHEMAHNTMRHMDARKQNMGVGLLADLAVILLSRGQVSNTNFSQLAATTYSQEFEAEADYVGLYIMANAGLPIDDAPKFWRRMAAAHPANIKTNHSASHPSTAYRMVALEDAVKEIQAKRASNAPLQPNMKDGRIAVTNKPDAAPPSGN